MCLKWVFYLIFQTSMESLRLANWWSTRGLSGNIKTSGATKNSIVSVSGIWIEGAVIDSGGNLSDATANSPSVNPAPVCSLAWVPSTHNSSTDDTNINGNMKIPLYFNAQREKILAFLEVPVSKVNENKWLQAGVVFFLGE